MENNDKDFIKMNLEDVKKIREFLDDLDGSNIKNVVNYGYDEVKFDNSIKELIQYLHQLVEDVKFHMVFLKRIQAGVYYGERESGNDICKGLINLNNMDGLKIIFDSIKDEFLINNSHGRVSLFTIGDNLMLDVISEQAYDIIWLCQYINDNKEIKKR